MWRALLRHFHRYPLREVYLRQLYFSGVQSFALAALAGAAVGTVVVVLVHRSFGQNSHVAMNVLTISTLQELAPLLIALLFSARSASALATEMATMQVTGEMATLRRWQISVTEYLVIPRVVMAGLSCALLYVYFSAAALLAGGIAMLQTDVLSELERLALRLPLSLPLFGFLKTLVFGSVIALIACQIGRLARHATTEIARLASQAVLHSVIAVFVLDAVFVLLFLGGD